MRSPGGGPEQQPRRPVVVGDEQVEVSVVVHVPDGRSPSHLQQRKRGTGHAAHVAKTGLPVIAKQLVGLTERMGCSGGDEVVLQPDRAIHGEQIQIAIVIEVEEARTERSERQTGSTQPERDRPVPKQPAAQIEIERVGLPGEIRDEQILVDIDIGGIDSHPGLRLTPDVQRHARQQSLFAERAASRLVDPQLIRIAVIRDVQVAPAVTVQIAGHHSQSGPECRPKSSRLGDILESSVPQIVEQTAGGRRVRIRPAVIAGTVGSETLVLCHS